MNYIEIYKNYIILKGKEEYLETLNNTYFEINKKIVRKKNLFMCFCIFFVLMISIVLFLMLYKKIFIIGLIGVLFAILSLYNGIEYLDEKSRINNILEDFFKLFINKKGDLNHSDILNYIKNDYEYYNNVHISIDKYKNDIYSEKFFKKIIENFQELNFEEQKEFINHYNEFKKINKNLKLIKKEFININNL